MDRELTDVVLIIDCSGSMEVNQSITEGNITEFLQSQKKLPGKVRLTLVEFSDSYLPSIKAYRQSLDAVRLPYRMTPDGGTALFDAIGYTVDRLGDTYAGLHENERPGLVVVAIVTDGAENSSRTFKAADIKRKITTQEKVYNWQFTFLGANQDSFLAAGNIGIKRDSVLNYSQASQGWGSSMAKNIGTMRCAVRSNEVVMNAYSDEDRVAAITSK